MEKVKLNLIGLNGNAFSIMGAFQSQAAREGWTSDEIGRVLTEAKSGDYDNLLTVISNHCEGDDDE